MSIIIFIIILGVLIFVHELGHFLVAKKSGIRVDEFAIGFPPRIFGFVKNGTRYALNLIPFGGYVKIFGETPDEESSDPNAKDSFVNKPKHTQALVLVAGIIFNILFAWILLSISLMSGFPSLVTEENAGDIKNPQVVITYVQENSPAELIKLESGDIINQLSVGSDSIEPKTISDVQNFVAEHSSVEIDLTYTRKGDSMTSAIRPVGGLIDDRPAIGIGMDMIGKIQYGFFEAFYRGLELTGKVILEIFVGLWILLSQAVTGNAHLSDVAGPVGIVGLVDTASNFGFFYLLGFTAFISINLAILNLLPFPALDGGRLLFVLIEAITRKKIPTKIANSINLAGFAILLLLMLVITVSDVMKLF